MKWAGILIGGIAMILAGILMGQRLRNRAELLSRIRLLLVRMERELSVRHLPTAQLFRELSADPDFQALSFLKEAARNFSGRESPADIWKQAVSVQKELAECPGASELLCAAGSVIGTADWESQAAQLQLLQEKAGEMIRIAEAKAQAEGKLYRGLGLLAAALLAVLAA